MEQMGLFEAMFSQRQITRFKPDPVPREAIEKIIEAAIKAPRPERRDSPRSGEPVSTAPRGLEDPAPRPGTR